MIADSATAPIVDDIIAPGKSPQQRKIRCPPYHTQQFHGGKPHEREGIRRCSH
jgi:hypothetical protein